MDTFVNLIPTLGFPIVCCLGMAVFIWKLIGKTMAKNEKDMEQVQERCKEREDKLYAELAEGRKINGQFANILSRYNVKLDIIQKDVEEIKNKVK